MRHILHLSILLLVLLTASSAFAWGPRAHMKVADLAALKGDDGLVPGTHKIIANYTDAYHCGAIFPDWGFGCGHSSETYASHPPTFAEIWFERLQSEIPRPITRQDSMTWAFSLGYLTHVYADWVFHGATGDVSLLLAAEANDSTNEDGVEGAMDIFLLHDEAIPIPAYFWPYGLISRVYADYGVTTTDSASLVTWIGTYESQIGILWRFGASNYSLSRTRYPWTFNNWATFWPDGANHASEVALQQIIRLWGRDQGHWIWQQGYDNLGYQGADGCYLASWAPDNNTGGEPLQVVGSLDGSASTLLLYFPTGLVPADIDSAKLMLYVHPLTSGAEGTYTLHALLADFDPGTGDDGDSTTFNGVYQPAASWTMRDGFTPWSVAGASSEGIDVGPAIATLTLTPADTQWIGFDITGTVTEWLTTPTTNHGLALFGPSDRGFLVNGMAGRPLVHRPTIEVFRGADVLSSVAESAVRGNYARTSVRLCRPGDPIRVPGEREVRLTDLLGHAIRLPVSGDLVRLPSDLVPGIYRLVGTTQILAIGVE